VDLLGEQEETETTGLVRGEVDRINALLRQLMSLAGPPRVTPGMVGVHGAIETIMRLMTNQLRANKIEELLLLKAGNDRIQGDSKQIQQALLNLLLNAVDAMPNGGRLVVHTEVVVATEHISKLDPGNRVAQLQVEIRDTGPGIPEEVLPRLFTPFVTTKPGGTGLGLAITRRIIREHHGTIQVDSSPGRGTTFRILLPLQRGGE
jgi:signal transduction histidine kinase